ncbi:50S ribosomal protein L16 [Patescibacteria group bacterium]|nr:50S ribosomal protein L16 [Patescibacteria group bacterium]
MLQPKKMKYRKWQKGRSLERMFSTKGTELSFGQAGLRSLDFYQLTDRQIDSVVKEMKRVLGKKGRVWLRVFPHKPVTKKPPEVRMGGGKGDLDHYVSVIEPGKMVVEVESRDHDLARRSLKAASYKLPIKTKLVLK